MGRIVLKPRHLRVKIPFRHEWGCPLTRNRSSWCFGLCRPVDGTGECGRVAGHALMGRTDKAIWNYLHTQPGCE